MIFNEYSSIVMLALLWEGTFELRPRVLGPGGAWLDPLQTQSSSIPPLGLLQEFGVPGGSDNHVLVYSLSAANKPPTGSIYTFVKFASRGNPALPPYCGGSPLGNASYDFIYVDEGMAPTTNPGVFDDVPCGQTWPADEDSDDIRKWSF